MSLIYWYDSYNLNIQEIDQQHRKLVDLINTLHDAMRARKTREVMGDIINGLMEYAATHFATEEKYFDLFDYPDKEAHKKQHRYYVEKINDIKTGFTEGRLMVSIETMEFLKDWLLNHIQGIDKKYVPFFHQHGMQ